MALPEAGARSQPAGSSAGVTAPTHPQEVTVSGERPSADRIDFVSLMRPHAGKLAIGMLSLVLTNAAMLLVPRLVNEGIGLVEHRDVERSIFTMLGTHPTTTLIVSSLIGAALFGALVRVWSRVVIFNIGRDIERELRSRLFAHLSTLSPTYFRQSSTGDLMSRLTNDLTNIRLTTGFALLNAANAALTFAGTLPLLIAVDAKVALLSLIPFPLVIVASQAFSGVMFRRTKENQAQLGQMNAAVQENLSGQAVVRAFARERGEVEKFQLRNDALFRSAMQLAFVRVGMFPLMGLIGSLGMAIALFVGGREVVLGRMDVGDLVEMNTRLLQLSWPTIALGFIMSVWQRGKASVVRINEVFAARPDIVDGPVQSQVVGKVEARGLTITPSGASRKALDGIAFTLEPGRVMGVVGKNGSGKTTLVKALSRLIPVDRGQLFVDDVDVVDWHLKVLHQGVSIVPEDGFLFSATLRDNLAFGAPGATDAEVHAAVLLADLGRDLRAFPEGLATMVGERGITLSGGQKQRVALARALLARPRVLVLDDSLSAVDAETEAKIVAALRAGWGGAAPSLVVVSHRLSAVREADEIIVLDDGHIAERGPHQALLQQGGIYAELWGKEQLLKALSGPEVGEPARGVA